MPDETTALVFNSRQQMNGWTMLRALDDECATLTIFDPQYRAVLDKLDYGNEGKRQAARAALPQMTDHDISLFVEQIERVLKPSGYLAFWLDKFSIGSGHHLKYLRFTERLHIVDLLCWEKQTFGMGRRFRGCTEYLLIIQKEPKNASRTWHNNSMRDFVSEKADKSLHPHAKPAEFTKALILTTTQRGDLVIDPCAGSFGVLTACRETGRTFCGCDLL